MNKFTLSFFLFLLSLFIFLASGSIDSQDGFQYLAVARNIYYKGEPTAPPYEYDTRKNIHMSTYVGRDGKTYSGTGLGYSLALVPSVALTDLVYNYYNVTPPEHFPLESDWLILLTASFTNAFFGALLGVVLYKYMRLFNIKHKKAIFLTIFGIISTNLVVYAKHSFAHIMFVSFLILSFYLIKKYTVERKGKYLLLSGLSYGVVVITYNITFFLPLFPYFVYIFLATKRKNRIKTTFKNLLLVFLGMLPFILVHLWFENLRARGGGSQTENLLSAARSTLIGIPIPLFIEGIFGQIFSPGRSLFLYSPILLVPFVFWHKLRKRNQELVVFILIFLIYVLFYASHYMYGGAERGYRGFWHGENSWGPRYLTPIIPFGVLVAAQMYKKLNKKAKLIVFYPLAVLGIAVNFLGVLIPYQTKFHNMERKFYINNTEFPMYDYVNIIPRYSPVINMSKNFLKLSSNFKNTVDNGKYNVKFYDGIDFPFNVGPERWRVIEKVGYISFDNPKDIPVKNLRFDLINHPTVPEASSSATVNYYLNNKPLLDKPVIFEATERKTVEIQLETVKLKNKNNDLKIVTIFEESDVVENNSQILGIISIYINDEVVNKESIDVPFVSELGPAITDTEYKNWGNLNKDPWKFWHIHTQVYERTPDFWWIKPVYYWDMPNLPLESLAFLNLSGIIYFGLKSLQGTKNKR